MNAQEARELTYAAEGLAHDEYESNMHETLHVIFAKIKEAGGKRKYNVDIQYHEGTNPRQTEKFWIGPTRVLRYEGTWPDGWSVVSDAGKDLCQRLSALNFTATIDYDGLNIDWTPLRPRSSTPGQTIQYGNKNNSN